MSARRSKRGLRRVSGAAAQVVGLAPQTTEMTVRANTMKTYLLRNQNTVERQKPARGRFGCRRSAEVRAVFGRLPGGDVAIAVKIGRWCCSWDAK